MESASPQEQRPLSEKGKEEEQNSQASSTDVPTSAPCAAQLRGHQASVTCLAVKEQEGLLFSGSDDKMARLWDLKTGKSVRCFACFAHEVTSVLFSKLAEHQVFVASGQKIFAFDLRRPEIILKEAQTILDYNTEEINQILMKGDLLAACDDSGEVKIIRWSDNSLYKTLRFRHKNICSSIAFHPKESETLLASGSLDSSIILWDYSTGKPTYTFDLNQRTGVSENSPQIVNPPFVHSIDLSQTSLAGGLGNSSVVVFDLNSKQQTHLLQWHSASVSQVLFPAFEPSSHVVSGSNDSSKNTVVLWSLPPAPEAKPSKKKKRASSSGSSLVTVSQPTLQVPHKRKVNWLASTSTPFLNGNLFVTDQTSCIYTYLVQ